MFLLCLKVIFSNYIMQLKDNIFLPEINALIEKHFSYAYCAILTGSHAEGRATEESDFDIWIISHSRDYIFHETFMRNGMKIQVTHYPMSKIDEQLWFDLYKRNGVFIGAFVKGYIIKDTKEYLKSLIDTCANLQVQGPAPTSYHELQSRKFQLIGLLSDFRSSKSEKESIIISHELLECYLTFYAQYYRLWTMGGGKYLVRTVNEHNNKLCADLFNSYTSYLKQSSKEPLIDFVNRYLSKFESDENGASISTNLAEIKQDYLVIQFYQITDFYEFNIAVLRYFEEISSHIPITKFTFRTRTIGDSIYSYDSIYLVLVNDDKDYLNDILIPQLNEVLHHRFSDFRFNFPVNIDLSFLTGAKELVKPAITWLNNFRSVLNQKSNTSSAIVISLGIFRLLKDLAFKNDETLYVDFLYYVFESWLPISYDSGYISNAAQLSIYKRKMIENFQLQFNSQKSQIKEICRLPIAELISPGLQSSFAELIQDIAKIKPYPYQLHPVFTHAGKEIAPLDQWMLFRQTLKLTLTSLMIAENTLAYLSFCLLDLRREPFKL